MWSLAWKLLCSLPSFNTGFPCCTAKSSCALGGEAELSLELHSSGLNCTDSSYLVKMGLLFAFQTALGFNPGKTAGFKPSPALFILQKMAHFSTQPYCKEQKFSPWLYVRRLSSTYDAVPNLQPGLGALLPMTQLPGCMLPASQEWDGFVLQPQLYQWVGLVTWSGPGVGLKNKHM